MRQVTVPDGGNKLTFEIRRLSAVEGEELWWKVLGILGAGVGANGSIEPNKIVLALAKDGSKEARSVLDTLLSCCSRKVGNALIPVDRKDCNGYITNPLTLVGLELEAAKENFGFFTEENALSSLDFLNITPTATKSEALPSA